MTRYKVKKQVAFHGKTASGQVNKTIGAVWEVIATYKNKATAERVAQHARIDNPDKRIVVEEQA